MTAPLPTRPTAYVRVAQASGQDDITVHRQQGAVLRAAAGHDWPEPMLYTDTGVPGWNRPGSALARLTDAITTGQHDAVITQDAARISRTPAHFTAFAALCAAHGTALELVYTGPVDPQAIIYHTGITS